MTQQVEIVTVTPKKAAEWLEANFKNNRTINTNRVAAYAADMTKGQWNFTGEGVKFDVNGSLIDGQHRLSAIVKADMAIDMLVVEGLETETMITMDTQMGRTLANVLKIMSYDRPHALASALLSVSYYEHYMKDKIVRLKGGSISENTKRGDHGQKPFKRLTNGSVTRQDALKLLNRRPTLIDSVQAMGRSVGQSKTLNVRPPASTVYLMHNVAEHGYGGASVIEYVDAVRLGVGDVDQPTYNLHQLLSRNDKEAGIRKFPSHTVNVLWMRGYEQYVGDVEMTKLRRNVGKMFPTIPGDVDWYLEGKAS